MSNQPTDQNENNNIVPTNQPESPDSQDRRDLVTKLGKFAIYAAPFTVMALNSQAATGSGPKRH